MKIRNVVGILVLCLASACLMGAGYYDVQGKYSGALAQRRLAPSQVVDNTAVATPIMWEREVYDSNNYHSLGADNAVFVIPPGVSKVRVAVQVELQCAGATGTVTCASRKNGLYTAGNAWWQSTLYIAGQIFHVNMASAVIAVAPGDRLDVVIVNQSAGTVQMFGSADFFCIEFIE